MPLVSNTRSIFLNDGQANLAKIVASGTGGWTGVVGNAAVSVSVWFKTTAERKALGTICAWGDDDTPGAGVSIDHLFSDKPHFVTGGGEFRRWEVTGSSGILDEEWHHFAFTCPVAGTPANVKFYHNGVLVSPEATVGSTPKNTSAGAFFRVGVDTKDKFQLNALVDELAVWNVELSAAAVAQIYNSGFANFDLTTNSGNYNAAANGQLWWRFENSAADQVIDSFGNGNSRNGFLPDLFVTTIYRADTST